MMNVDEIRLKGIELNILRMAHAMDDVQKAVIESTFVQDIPAFCTLKKAAGLKGVVAYQTLVKRSWQQPCCGQNWLKFNGHRCWKRADIINWLKITDETLEEYANANGVDISKYFSKGRNL